MLGNRLKELRTSKKMTQDDMANLLNIKRQTYSAYERGISFPDINSVSYMADFFNVSVDYILGKTDIPTVPTPEQNNEFSEALKDFSEEERHQIENYIKFIKSQRTSKEWYTLMNTNTLTNYTFPPLTLLEQPKTSDNIENKEALMSIGKEILESLKGFGIVALLLKITHNLIMTRYEIKIVNGKLSEVLELKDDIAMRTGSLDIYITVSQNSYGTVNIDIPNATFSPVNLIELLSSDEFRNNNYGIPVCIGMDASGPVIRDIETMSSLLIFGTTGSGKSICIHSIIMSILYNSTPDMIRFIMVDPEPSELVVYKDIPHMLLPVLTEPIKA